MASAGPLSPLLKGVKFIASATVGVPLAVAATAFLAIFASVAWFANKTLSFTRKSIGAADKIITNPFLQGIQDFFTNAISDAWDFGLYAYKTTLEAESKVASRVFGHSGNMDRYEEMTAMLYESIITPSEGMPRTNTDRKKIADEVAEQFARIVKTVDPDFNLNSKVPYKNYTDEDFFKKANQAFDKVEEILKEAAYKNQASEADLEKNDEYINALKEARDLFAKAYEKKQKHLEQGSLLSKNNDEFENAASQNQYYKAVTGAANHPITSKNAGLSPREFGPSGNAKHPKAIQIGPVNTKETIV